MLTLIIGPTYQEGRNWLQDNWRAEGLNPQQARIVTNAEALRGVREVHVIWLPGWSDGPNAKAIHAEFVAARIKYGKAVTEEHIPDTRPRRRPR